MSDPSEHVGGLDDLCPACHRIVGDHTLREWSACMKTPAVDLPYQEIPADMAKVVSDRLREQFTLDDDWIIADTVTVKSLVLDGAWGQMKVRTPALLHEFAIGNPNHGPMPVGKVLYVAPPDGLKRYGVLVRDCANGAVNAATRSDGPQGRGMGGGKHR